MRKRRHEENLTKKKSLKKTLQQLKKTDASNSEEIKKNFGLVQSQLDKSAKTNIIHPNKASRLKSRMAKKLAQASASASTPTKPVKKVKKTKLS